MRPVFLITAVASGLLIGAALAQVTFAPPAAPQHILAAAAPAT